MPTYTAVPPDEEKLLWPDPASDESTTDSIPPTSRPPPRSKYSIITSLLHWLAHLTTLTLLSILIFRRPSPPQTPFYSPAFPSSPQPLHHTIFQSAFWQHTPYKAYPSPPTNKTIAAWHHLTSTPALNLTATEITNLGLSPDSVQWPQSAGGGYIGFLESAHQLHCLESLWLRHHYEKDQGLEIYREMREKIESMPEIEEAHFEHCVDVIRQRLMCTADPAIVTFRWVKGVSTPYPNFHSGHMCADYEGLLEWGEGRKADMSRVEGWDYHVNLDEGDVEIDHLPR